MPRTPEKFARAFEDLKRMLSMHQKPFWFVPTQDDYAVSVIQPKPEELPNGTRAILYNPAIEEVDYVDALN